MVSKMESTRGVLEPNFLSSTLKKNIKNSLKILVETIACQEKNDEEICAPKK